jgi:hypothetical protein
VGLLVWLDLGIVADGGPTGLARCEHPHRREFLRGRVTPDVTQSREIEDSVHPRFVTLNHVNGDVAFGV